jgi:hypothetical protein
MGTSSSVNELTGKLERLAKDLNDPTAALNATALQAKGIFIASAAGVIGRKVAGKRKAIGARYDIGKRGAGVGQAIVTYTGPAHLVNNPTRDHMIFPRGARGTGGRRRRRGGQALTIGGNVRAWAHHPGTGGKHFFEAAKAIVTKTAPETFGKAQLTVPLRRIF